MKKILLIVVLAIVGSIGSDINAQGLILKAGLNMNSCSFSTSDSPRGIEPYNTFGFHVGAGYEVLIHPNFVIEPSLLFDTRGGGIKFYMDDVDDEGELVKSEFKGNFNLYSVEVPVALKGIFPISDNIRVVASVSPFMNLFLSGTFKGDVKVQDKVIDEQSIEIQFSGDEKMVKRFNFGTGFGAGLEVNRVNIGIGYDLMLTNSYAKPSAIDYLKFRTLKMTFGYRF